MQKKRECFQQEKTLRKRQKDMLGYLRSHKLLCDEDLSYSMLNPARHNLIQLFKNEEKGKDLALRKNPENCNYKIQLRFG